MKQIISGKVYDTATAKECGDWSNNQRGFDWISETLYRKKTGEFFVHGEGGARTQYATRVEQNMWAGGERIMPLSYAEAREWAEQHLDGDAYEAIFGEVTEDGSRQQVGYSLSVTTVETIRRRAGELGISASEYIDRLVAAAEK